MSDYTLTEESARTLKKLVNTAKYQPPRRHVNTRPTDNGGGELYKATMKEPWTAGKAECDIYSIDGTTFTDTTVDEDVYDGLGIFSSLTTGNQLLVLFQNGKYYAIQAPCP